MAGNSHNHIIISQKIDPVRILEFQEVGRRVKPKKIIVLKLLKWSVTAAKTEGI